MQSQANVVSLNLSHVSARKTVSCLYPLHVLILSLNAAIFDTMAKCFVYLIGRAQDKHGELPSYDNR